MGKTRKPRPRTYKPKPFESYPAVIDPKRSYDTSANIYHSMLLSPAWMDLTPKQKELYLVCKDQRYSQKRKPPADDFGPDAFYMNRFLWLETYKLYSPGNQKGFYRDMTALVEHGFIRCIASGRYNKQKSVYGFSDKWRWYGDEELFIIPNEDKMTTGTSWKDDDLETE